RSTAYQLIDHRFRPFWIAHRPVYFDTNVFAFRPTTLLQACSKCAQPALTFAVVGCGHENANSSNRSILLSARRQRPCRRRAAERRDELPAPHSITSSARASKVGGTARSIALAA